MILRKIFNKHLFIVLTCALIGFASFSAQAGHLVIIGGHLEQEDAAIYKEMVKLAHAHTNSKPKVCIWLTNTGVPDESYSIYSKAFNLYGANSVEIPISSLKPKWKGNQNKLKVVKLIKKCDINFFTGGDQSRTPSLLYNKDGSDSLALNALRYSLNEGAVVAGSSAGDMIQSSPMITGGDSVTSLANGGKPKGMVTTSKGIGFLEPEKIILDSHFSQRGRLGRLLVALKDTNINTGVGIDEATAVIANIDSKGNSIGNWDIIGDNYVTIAKLSGDLKTIQNADISILASGDKYDPNTGQIIPAPYKSKIGTSTQPYYSDDDYWSDGVFAIDSEIPYMLSRLVDSTANDIRGTSLVENTFQKGTFADKYNAKGVEIKFSKTALTEGYYGKPKKINPDIENAHWYTATHLKFNYRPVTISVSNDNVKRRNIQLYN